MCRNTIIFGNGLGMALDPDSFSLENAMRTVWTDTHSLEQTQRVLLQNCLQAQDDAIIQPRSESDLEISHLAVNACEMLKEIENNGRGWLNQYGLDFPNATRSFLTQTAWCFHDHSHFLPQTFLDPLFSFLRETKSNVATLNYDNLLYQPMIEAHILRGYDGFLVDGFWESRGFLSSNLKRLYDNDFGYYLHLHGSPLYVDDGDMLRKQLQGEASMIPTRHLVLTLDFGI